MDTTTDSLMDFWVSVNERSTKLRTFDDIDRRLRKLKSVVGIDFPFRRIETSSIRTRADAERLNRKLRKNALHAMFALIADTVMEEEILDHEDLRWMFSKIQSREEDIDRGELGVADLVGVLEDEFSLRLADQDQNLTLELIDEAANVMPEADTYSG